MAKLSIVKGTTSKIVTVFIQDSSVTTGAGLTGLAYNSGSLTAYYHREGAASATAITLATMTLGTWATGGFVAVDGTNMPGVYSLGIPDAALASGAKSVVVMLKGAANMAPLLLEIELTATDNQTADVTAAIKAKTDLIPSDPAETSDIPSAATIAAAVWAYAVEGSYTAVQFMRLTAAVLYGKATGLGTTTVYFRDMADSKNRVTATVDSVGNRSAQTHDVS